jgi:putative ABC transport system permease protein
MSSRWKKVWADFWSNKTRTILTILTIGVGVFAVGAVSNIQLIMEHDMDADFLSTNPPEAHIYAGPLNDDLVKAASKVPGVKAVEGRITSNVQLLMPDGKLISTQVTSVKTLDELKVGTLKPASPSDKTLPELKDKEVLLDRSAGTLNIKTGDTITLKLSDGKFRELRVGGFIHDAAGYPYNLANYVTAYVTTDTMQWLGGPSDFTQLAFSVTENTTDQKHVEEVAQAVADRLKHGGSTVYYVDVYQPGHHFAWSITQGVMFVLSILGWLTVLLSAFLIVNTITSLLTQQTRQIGIMKATGASTPQIVGMYLVLILGFGLAALLISIPVSATRSYDVVGSMATFLGFDQSPFKLYPEAITQQAIVALVVPLLAGVFPLLRSVRITVREALSDYGLGGAAKPKTASVNKSMVLIPRPMRISIRNTFRRKTRLALTLFTLVLAGAIFIAVFNLWASFDKTMQDIQGYFLADINVSLDRAYRFDRVSALAESVPGVKSVEGWLEISGTLMSDNKDDAGSQILFVAPPSSSTLIKPIITQGRWLTPGDENALVIGNQLLKVRPDLKVGDWLNIKINGTEYKWHVIGFYQLTGNVNPPLIYTNYEYISRLIDQPGQAYSLRVITDAHDAASQKVVNDRLQSLFDANGVRISGTQLSTEWSANQKAQTDLLVYFLLFMSVLIAIVGGLGLTGTMSINVLERTREIGVMRAIGASNLDIQGIVLVEGMIIGLISWIVSILLAFPITNVLAFGVGSAIMQAPMPPVYNTTGILVWLLGILFIGGLASALPAHRASSLTVRDTLAYE